MCEGDVGEFWGDVLGDMLRVYAVHGISDGDFNGSCMVIDVTRNYLEVSDLVL